MFLWVHSNCFYWVFYMLLSSDAMYGPWMFGQCLASLHPLVCLCTLQFFLSLWKISLFFFFFFVFFFKLGFCAPESTPCCNILLTLLFILCISTMIEMLPISPHLPIHRLTSICATLLIVELPSEEVNHWWWILLNFVKTIPQAYTGASRHWNEEYTILHNAINHRAKKREEKKGILVCYAFDKLQKMLIK